MSLSFDNLGRRFYEYLKEGMRKFIKKRKLQDVDVASCFESRFIKHIISFSE